MEFPTALVLNAIIAGLLLGGFYAAVSVGISISFGMLDVVNIAHPAFIILGSYIAYIVNDRMGLDPIAVSVVLSPLFFALGMLLYRIYYLCFEKRGQESLRGLAFFFGILFITEVALVLIFGVDYRMVRTAYSETTWRLGPVDFPMRLVVPFLVSMAMVIGVQFLLRHTFFVRQGVGVGHARRRVRPLPRGIVHLHLLWPVVGARGFLRAPARDARLQALGALRTMSPGKFAAVACAAAIAIVAASQLVTNDYFFSAAYTVLQFIVLATAWNILGGYTGYVNFVSAAFFATGAYSS